METEEYLKYIDELRRLSTLLERWFTVDKIKPWVVYVYTKKDGDGDSFNIFDIEEYSIIYYKDFNVCDIPVGALPIIQEIQTCLKKISDGTS